MVWSECVDSPLKAVILVGVWRFPKSTSITMQLPVHKCVEKASVYNITLTSTVASPQPRFSRFTRPSNADSSPGSQRSADHQQSRVRGRTQLCPAVHFGEQVPRCLGNTMLLFQHHNSLTYTSELILWQNNSVNRPLFTIIILLCWHANDSVAIKNSTHQH